MSHRHPRTTVSQTPPSLSPTPPTLPLFTGHPHHNSQRIASVIRKVQEHAPNSTQLIGLLTLVISAIILLLLAGLTLTSTILGLVFVTPVALVSSPIWLPIGTILFAVVAGLLSVGGLGVTSVAVFSWMYRYFRGFHPVGSDKMDYARSKIVDTAGHVKDYAKECGGYLQSKVKDEAPRA